MYPAWQEGDREFSTDGIEERRCTKLIIDLISRQT
jgi:hypothetical protein